MFDVARTVSIQNLFESQHTSNPELSSFLPFCAVLKITCFYPEILRDPTPNVRVTRLLNFIQVSNNFFEENLGFSHNFHFIFVPALTNTCYSPWESLCSLFVESKHFKQSFWRISTISHNFHFIFVPALKNKSQCVLSLLNRNVLNNLFEECQQFLTIFTLILFLHSKTRVNVISHCWLETFESHQTFIMFLFFFNFLQSQYFQFVHFIFTRKQLLFVYFTYCYLYLSLYFNVRPISK